MQSLTVLLIPWFVISLFFSYISRQKYGATVPLLLWVTEPSLPFPPLPQSLYDLPWPCTPCNCLDDSNIACFFFQVGRLVLLGRSWRDTDSEDSHIKSALLFTLDRGEVIFFCWNWVRDSVIEAAIISSFLFIMSFVFWILHWGALSWRTNERRLLQTKENVTLSRIGRITSDYCTHTKSQEIETSYHL